MNAKQLHRPRLWLWHRSAGSGLSRLRQNLPCRSHSLDGSLRFSTKSLAEAYGDADLRGRFLHKGDLIRVWYSTTEQWQQPPMPCGIAGAVFAAQVFFDKTTWKLPDVEKLKRLPSAYPSTTEKLHGRTQGIRCEDQD
ncbi:hypothetical protein [Variovorax sp. GT1P44]|uniref:hypothetical protein n=1 Tax=Variovorax sp. GT1P44 TaxID=3443742 RepID=UPI003F46F824